LIRPFVSFNFLQVPKTVVPKPTSVESDDFDDDLILCVDDSQLASDPDGPNKIDIQSCPPSHPDCMPSPYKELR
jgi:hypothetical protein